jgi:hypothetical protein
MGVAACITLGIMPRLATDDPIAKEPKNFLLEGVLSLFIVVMFRVQKIKK